ncbi:MAG: PorT family protein [Aureispira sp.]|nr:PorT family protein [Aureispira sp.]
MQFRNLIFLAIIYLGLSINTSAQSSENNRERRFNAAIVAGLNFSQIDGDAIAGYHKVGMSVGGRAGIKLAERWELSMELLYSQRGSQSPLVKGQPRGLKYHLDYFDIPVEINFKDWKAVDGKDRPFMRAMIGAGFTYSRLFRSKKEVGGLEDPAGVDDLKRDDVMFQFTVSFYAFRYLGFSLRWGRSLFSMHKTDAFINHTLNFRAFYQF